MKQLQILLISIFIFQPAFTQQTILGQYNKSNQIFVPVNQLYSNVSFNGAANSIIHYYGLQGIIDTNGTLQISMDTFNLLPCIKNSDYFIKQTNQNKYFICKPNHFQYELSPLFYQTDYYHYNANEFRYYCYILKGQYYILDIKANKTIFGPWPYQIKSMEQEGFLVGKPVDNIHYKAYKIKKHFTPLYDTLDFAWYDTNMMQKTDFLYKEIKKRNDETFYKCISNYGKGLLTETGKEIAKPIYDNASAAYKSQYYFILEFDGMHDIETYDMDGFSGVEGSKAVIINRQGQLISKDTFLDRVSYFSEDSLFEVTLTGKPTVFVPGPKDEIVPVGLLIYTKNPGRNLMRTDGTYVFSKNTSYINPIGQHCYLLQNENKNCIYNVSTKKTIELPKLGSYSENNGFLKLYEKDQQSLVGKDGKIYAKGIDIDIDWDGYALVKTTLGYLCYNKAEKKMFTQLFDTINVIEQDGNDFFIVGKKTSTSQFKYGVIDNTGKSILPIQFESIEFGRHAYFMFIAKHGKQYTLFSQTGKKIFSCAYPILYYNDNYHHIGVLVDDKYVGVDTQNLVIEKIKDYFVLNTEKVNCKILFKNKKYNIADSKNHLLLKEDADGIQIFEKEQILLLKDINGFTLLNTNAKRVLPNAYDTIYRLNDGRFIAIKNHQFSILMQNGEVTILNNPMDDIEFNLPFTNGYKYKLGEKYGIIGFDDKILLEAKYKLIDNWQFGYHVASDSGYCFLDLNFKQVCPWSNKRYIQSSIGHSRFLQTTVDNCVKVYNSKFEPINYGCFSSFGWMYGNLIGFSSNGLGKPNYILVDSVGAKLFDSIIVDIKQFRNGNTFFKYNSNHGYLYNSSKFKKYPNTIKSAREVNWNTLLIVNEKDQNIILDSNFIQIQELPYQNIEAVEINFPIYKVATAPNNYILLDSNFNKIPGCDSFSNMRTIAYNQLLIVQKGKLFAILSRKGELLTDFKYKYIEINQQSEIKATLPNNEYDFFNLEGKLLHKQNEVENE